MCRHHCRERWEVPAINVRADIHRYGNGTVRLAKCFWWAFLQAMSFFPVSAIQGLPPRHVPQVCLGATVINNHCDYRIEVLLINHAPDRQVIAIALIFNAGNAGCFFCLIFLIKKYVDPRFPGYLKWDWMKKNSKWSGKYGPETMTDETCLRQW